MSAEPLGVEVLDGRDVLDAGVVDEDVGVEGGGVDGVGVGEVDAQRVAAEGGGDLLGGGLVAVQDGDVRAEGGEVPGDGGTDAARAAGDQGAATLQGEGPGASTGEVWDMAPTLGPPVTIGTWFATHTTSS